MTDTKRESLSALIDGEVGEMELHRLVREFGDDESLIQSWSAYQHIRAAIRPADAGSATAAARADEPAGDKSTPLATRPQGQLHPVQHRLLYNRIGMAVQAEATHQTPVAGLSRSGKRYLAAGSSLAIAASLVVAVMMGLQNTAQDAPDIPRTALQQAILPGALLHESLEAPDISGAALSLVEVPDISGTMFLRATLPNMSPHDSLELVELNEAEQRRLRAYLNQHNYMARSRVAPQLVNSTSEKQ